MYVIEPSTCRDKEVKFDWSVFPGEQLRPARYPLTKTHIVIIAKYRNTFIWGENRSLKTNHTDVFSEVLKLFLLCKTRMTALW